MKMGVHKDQSRTSTSSCRPYFYYNLKSIPLNGVDIAAECVQPVNWSSNIDKLVDMIVAEAKPKDHILIMSNGSFGGIHEKLLDKLASTKFS